jgi:hypothetical protein
MKKSLKNIPLRLFQDYLTNKGLKKLEIRVVMKYGHVGILAGQLCFNPILIQFLNLLSETIFEPWEKQLRIFMIFAAND